MPDYKKMYIKLFQSQTKAIRILQEAKIETEEMYIESEPPEIRLLTRSEENPDAEPPKKD